VDGNVSRKHVGAERLGVRTLYLLYAREGKWLSRLAFNQLIAGSTPVPRS
jgi:hypothetical protein